MEGEERVVRRLRSQLGVGHVAGVYALKQSIGSSESQHGKGEKRRKLGVRGKTTSTQGNEHEQQQDRSHEGRTDKASSRLGVRSKQLAKFSALQPPQPKTGGGPWRCFHE